MQDDSLMATATPREALLFSGRMRLPSSVTKEQIEHKVDELLEELGLTECANVMIGGPLIKGISGGQRKRTSVGVELITDPSVSKRTYNTPSYVLVLRIELYLLLHFHTTIPPAAVPR